MARESKNVKLTPLQLAIRVLEEIKAPSTAEQIWAYAVEKGLDELVQKNKGAKSGGSIKSITTQIYQDLSKDKNQNNDEQSTFAKTGRAPTLFYLKKTGLTARDLSNAETKSVEEPKEATYKERLLHPFLAYHAFNSLQNIYTKTIFHEKARKKGVAYADWVYPDMVGVELPFDRFSEQVIEFSKGFGGGLIKLHSFELKKQLTFGNLRNVFFQTVSNSTWANESYLVAPKIDEGEEFLEELSRLSSAFGVGVIKLDLDEPDDGEVLLPAQFRNQPNWETINKLAALSPCFEEFLSEIQKGLKINEIRDAVFDPIPDREQLLSSFKIKSGPSQQRNVGSHSI